MTGNERASAGRTGVSCSRPTSGRRFPRATITGSSGAFSRGPGSGARLHDLRHTAALLMLTAGVNPRVVMEALGHSQISVTMNTYTHVSTSTARDAVGLIDDQLRNDAGDLGEEA